MGFFIQNDAWDGYMTPDMLDDHLAETVTLTKNHGVTDVYPFVGYYNGTWEITYINGTKALNNVANFQAIITAFNAEGIDVWAYIGDVRTPSYDIQPLNITAENYGAIQALHADLLEIGFAGIVDDAEQSFMNYGKDVWINYSNNASAAVAALGTGKLYGACIFNDWEQNVYPNLELGDNGYIFLMFYTTGSLFESVDVDAYWAENFGQYGRDTPPASKVILCYTTQYVSAQNLNYHLNNLTYQLSRNSHPNLAGFGGWNLDYMTGEDSQDWAYYDAFRTRLGLTTNTYSIDVIGMAFHLQTLHTQQTQLRTTLS